MCFAIPSRIIAYDADNQMARIDTLGRQREVSTHLILDALAVGDYLLIQSGFAMEKISRERALDSLELYQQLIQEMEAGEA
ncbi:hydrogenase assembly chaperone hypC/hupF [Ferrimonas balearica DSM 9799]|uniref:Hydrogenase assembly chaperone hypC/hupF n=1 Tax=Ferrimonas balearica (strain DSM 9799 / CCM 4581 / KCTC 23876 / PAT) TaxID=550540 RepID=E1SV47_FERBD|nr:HypC/HybG/HupF family hydrogenase formation chaperone [Ferrimonas balearica]ADN77347.1 hydrogenase assembly chaperone hypC/hupF [Ferrimonas balearica DSM 9799]MBW3164689.1 HypC/HybG/HupF family hydrogenase formation chaperone [Ferrimonas balearica]MBY6224215.1 HypC/HybG/HupF family hydrogenase formation chaperone [Ferrimonas balearica]